MSRYYQDSVDTVVERRIASATRNEKPVVVGGMDKFDVGAVPKASDAQKAAALAYLTRHDALDIAEILGLVGVDEKANPARGLRASRKTITVRCPYCEANAGQDCFSASGTRVTYHRDRIRAAKDLR